MEEEFKNGDKVVYTYTRHGTVIKRKGIFVRYIRSTYANAELCMVQFQTTRVPQYALASGLTKRK